MCRGQQSEKQNKRNVCALQSTGVVGPSVLFLLRLMLIVNEKYTTVTVLGGFH